MSSPAPARPAGAPRLELITRVGCHLCERAREVLAAVVPPGGWVERDVDDPSADPGWRAEHTDWVPVLLLDGQVLDRFRVDPRRVQAALAQPPPAAEGAPARQRPWWGRR